MSLDKFGYILAISEEQTLTRASEKIYVSQPTLTNYVNKLEDELGVKLFDRTVTPIKVTRAGALYIEKMKKIQRDSLSLKNELKQMADNKTVIRLGIGNTRGNHWLPLIVPEILNRFPNIKLQFVEKGEDYLEKAVLNSEIDLAFGVLNTSYVELTYEFISEEKVYLAIPRKFDCVKHLEESDGTCFNPYTINSKKIGSIPFLLPYPGNGFHHVAQMLLEQEHIVPSCEYNYGNMNTAYQLVGSGVAALFITPTFFVGLYPESTKKIAFCKFNIEPFVRRSVVGFRLDNHNIKIIKGIIEIVKEKILPVLQTLE